MAIEFNAGTGANTGTITGLAVGGLPSGIIDADTVANSSIATAKTTFGGGVKLKHIECIKYGTRTTHSTIPGNTPNSYVDYADFTYNKQYSNTTLLTHWLVHGWGATSSYATNTQLYVENDADTSINQTIFNGLFPYNQNDSQAVLNATAHFTTILPAGNCSFKLRANNPNTGSNPSGAVYKINPNSTDDNRLGSGGVVSRLVIMEVEP